MQEKNTTGKCLSCGKELHDKRPYCQECRRKQELERRKNEKIEENKETKKTILKTLPIILSLLIILASIFYFVFLNTKQEVVETGTGSIKITTEPEGAQIISLDGTFSTGISPLIVKDLPSGKICKYSIIMEGCKNTNEIYGVKVKKDTETVSNTILEKQGTLNLKTTPPFADIYIDGIKYEKQTPTEIEEVPVGTRNIKFVYPNGNSVEQPVEVKWKETTNINILQDTEKAGIEFNIPEGIKVYSDGKFIGKTPLPVLLTSEGLHKITLISDRYITYREEAETKKGIVTTLNPKLRLFGHIEISADRPAYLYKEDGQLAPLPIKVSCMPNEKFVAKIISADGVEMLQGYVLKEGEFRRVSLKLPPPPPPPVIADSAPMNYQNFSSEPFTDFSQFRLEYFFPPATWEKTNEFSSDVDLDGESEKILGFKNLSEQGEKGCKVYAFLIKKHDGNFFDRIPLRNPRIGCLGEGEIISLEVVKNDYSGYREIIYSVGNADDGITSRGAFTIYKGGAYSASWSPR